MKKTNTTKKKKAQSATEYLLILAIVLAVVSMLFTIVYEMLTAKQMKVKTIKARDLVDELGKGAALVYQEGKDSKTKVYVHVPEGISGYRSNGSIILINLTVGPDTIPYIFVLGFPMEMELSTTEGYYWANITSMGNKVRIVVR
ncbi:MAG: hypothetical protein QW594_00600 [Candidatus Woesearchaeota archaeon]